MSGGVFGFFLFWRRRREDGSAKSLPSLQFPRRNAHRLAPGRDPPADPRHGPRSTARWPRVSAKIRFASRVPWRRGTSLAKLMTHVEHVAAGRKRWRRSGKVLIVVEGTPPDTWPSVEIAAGRAGCRCNPGREAAASRAAVSVAAGRGGRVGCPWSVRSIVEGLLVVVGSRRGWGRVESGGRRLLSSGGTWGPGGSRATWDRTIVTIGGSHRSPEEGGGAGGK